MKAHELSQLEKREFRLWLVVVPLLVVFTVTIVGKWGLKPSMILIVIIIMSRSRSSSSSSSRSSSSSSSRRGSGSGGSSSSSSVL